MESFSVPCACCSIPFAVTGLPEDKFGQHRCSHCEDHTADTLSSEVEMLRDHESRRTAQLNMVWGHVRKVMRENEDLREADSRRREQVAAALEDRGRYREVVNEIADLHDARLAADACSCGAQACEVALIVSQVTQSRR